MYTPKLTLIETERALKEVKNVFEAELSQALNLTRISAPLFVSRALSSGMNRLPSARDACVSCACKIRS